MRKGDIDDVPDAIAPITAALIGRYLPNLQPADRDDLTQDIILHVLQVYPQFDPSRAKLTTWAFTIIRNQILDARRRMKRQPRMLDIDEIDRAAPPAGADDTPDADNNVNTNRLTRKQRRVYSRLAKGQTPMEIARALGLHRVTVAQMKQRIIRTLTPAA